MNNANYRMQKIGNELDKEKSNIRYYDGVINQEENKY